MSDSLTAMRVYQGLIAGPIALSLLYSLSVQCFLSGWHECSWTHHLSSISLRLTLVIVAVAILYAMEEYKHDAFLLPAVVFPILAVTLMVRTRKIYITGPTSEKYIQTQAAKDKIVLITGANTGIGKETARQLFMAGATVILACRSEQRARDAMEDILSSQQHNTSSGTATETTQLRSKTMDKDRLLFLQCDVSDYDSVRKSYQELNKMLRKLDKSNDASTTPALDVLINNAGIMMGTRKENKAGHELTMACNHLGHFLLTNLLMPNLRASKYGGRVVVVTSSTYTLADKGMDLDDLQCEKRSYTMFSQYAQSKLANILMGKELARRESETKNTETKKPVKVYNVHPGLVRTDVVRNMPWYLKYPNMMFSLVLVTLQKAPPAGAYTNVFCALDESLETQSGEYFSNSEAFVTNQFTHDEDAAKRLWTLSCNLVGLKE